MDPLEQEIRIALGEKRRESMMEYASRHPEFKESLKKAADAGIKYVNDTISEQLSKISKKVSGEEMARIETIVKELAVPTMVSISKELTYEGILESAAKSYITTATSGKEEANAYFKQYENMLRQKDLNDVVDLESESELLKKMAESSVVQDVLVDRLKKKAKEKGLDYALKQSTIDETWREIFPDEEEMKRYEKINFELPSKNTALQRKKRKKILNSIKVLYLGGDDSKTVDQKAKVIDNVFESLLDSTDEFFKVLGPAYNEMTEESIKRIYGNG
jgi:hypothetical protein